MPKLAYKDDHLRPFRNVMQLPVHLEGGADLGDGAFEILGLTAPKSL